MLCNLASHLQGKIPCANHYLLSLSLSFSSASALHLSLFRVPFAFPHFIIFFSQFLSEWNPLSCLSLSSHFFTTSSSVFIWSVVWSRWPAILLHASFRDNVVINVTIIVTVVAYVDVLTLFIKAVIVVVVFMTFPVRFSETRNIKFINDRLW